MGSMEAGIGVPVAKVLVNPPVNNGGLPLFLPTIRGVYLFSKLPIDAYFIRC